MGDDLVAELLRLQLMMAEEQRVQAEQQAQEQLQRAKAAKAAATARRRREQQSRRAKETEDAQLALWRRRYDATLDGQVELLRSSILASLDGPGKRKMLAGFMNTEWAVHTAYAPAVDTASHVEMLQRRALDCVSFPLEMWKLLKADGEEEDENDVYVNVTINSAVGLSGDGGILKSIKPYCTVCVVQQQGKLQVPVTPMYQTSIKKGKSSPSWGESFRFGLKAGKDGGAGLAGHKLAITVRNVRLLHEDNELAFLSVDLTSGVEGTRRFARGTGSLDFTMSVADAADEADAQRDLTSIAELNHFGFVEKRARKEGVFSMGNRSGRDWWSSRYVVVKGAEVAWYKKDKDYTGGKEPRGRLTLTDKSEVRDSALKAMTFEIQTDSDHLVLKPPTAGEKEGWIKAVRRSIQLVKLPTRAPDCLVLVGNLFSKPDLPAVSRVISLVRAVTMKASTAVSTPAFREQFTDFMDCLRKASVDVTSVVPPDAAMTNGQAGATILAAMACLAGRYLSALGPAGVATVEDGAIPLVPYCIYLNSTMFVELLKLLGRFGSKYAGKSVNPSPASFSAESKINSEQHSRACLAAALILTQANCRAASDLRVDVDQLNRPVRFSGSGGGAGGAGPGVAMDDASGSTVISCIRLVLVRLVAFATSAAGQFDIQDGSACALADGLPLLAPSASIVVPLLSDALRHNTVAGSDKNAGRGFRVLLLALADRMQRWGAVSQVVFPRDDMPATTRKFHENSAERVFESLRLEQLVRRIPAERLGTGIRRGRGAMANRVGVVEDDFKAALSGGAGESKGAEDTGRDARPGMLKTEASVFALSAEEKSGDSVDEISSSGAGASLGVEKETEEERVRRRAALVIQRAFLAALARRRAEEEDVDPIALLKDSSFVEQLFQYLRQGDSVKAPSSAQAAGDSGEAPQADPVSMFASVYGLGSNEGSDVRKGAALAVEGPITDSRVIGFVRWASRTGGAAPTSMAHVIATAKKRRLASVPVDVPTLARAMLEPHPRTQYAALSSPGRSTSSSGPSGDRTRTRSSIIGLDSIMTSVDGLDEAEMADKLLADMFRIALGASPGVDSDTIAATAALLLSIERDLLSRVMMCESSSLRSKPVVQALSAFASRALEGFQRAVGNAVRTGSPDASLLDGIAGRHFLVLAPLLASMPSLASCTGLVLDTTPLLHAVWSEITKAGVNSAPAIRTAASSESGAQKAADFGAEFGSWFAKLASDSKVLLPAAEGAGGAGTQTVDWKLAVVAARDSVSTTAAAWRKEGWGIICGAVGATLSTFASRLVAGGQQLSLAEESMSDWLTSSLMAGGIGVPELRSISAMTPSKELRRILNGVGSTGAAAAADSTIEEEEEGDSRLQFLVEVMDNIGRGGALNAVMEKMRVCTRIQRRLSGKRLDVACRAAVAACLYMTGYADEAMGFAAGLDGSKTPSALEDENGPFLKIWKLCWGGLREWASRRKRVMEQKYSDAGLTASTGAKDMADKIWNKIVKGVVGRSKVVLKLNEVDADESLAAALAAQRADQAASGAGAVDEARERKREKKRGLFNRFRRARTVEKAPTELFFFDAGISEVIEHTDESYYAVAQAVCGFVESNTPAGSAAAVLKQVGRRGICRFYGLKVYVALLHPYVEVARLAAATDSESSDDLYDKSIDFVLSGIIRAFRTLPTEAGSIHHHFLDHVRAAGSEVVGGISGSSRSLLSALVKLLRGPVSAPSTAILLLDSFRLNFRDMEHQFLLDSGLIETVHSIVVGMPPAAWKIHVSDKVRSVAMLLLQNLTLLVFRTVGASAFEQPKVSDSQGLEAEEEDSPTPVPLNLTQKDLLHRYKEDLAALSTRSSWAATCDDATSNRLCLHILSLVGAVADHQAARRDQALYYCNTAANVSALLVSDGWLTLLLTVASGGSSTFDLRVRHVAVRIVSKHIAKADPSKLRIPKSLRTADTDDGAAATAKGDSSGKQLPLQLLDMCGRLILSAQSAAPDVAFPGSTGGVGGLADRVTAATWQQTLAFEVAVLFRKMMNSSAWSSGCKTALSTAFNKAAGLWTARIKSKNVVEDHRLLAALLTLSSGAEKLIDGVRVTVNRPQGTDVGNVVAIGDPLSRHRGLREDEALVVLEAVSPRRGIVIPLAHLTTMAAQGVSIELSSLPLKSWIVPLCQKILQDNAATKRDTAPFAEEIPLPWAMIRSQALELLSQCLAEVPGSVSWLTSGKLLPALVSISAHPAARRLTGTPASLGRRSLDVAAGVVATLGNLSSVMTPALPSASDDPVAAGDEKRALVSDDDVAAWVSSPVPLEDPSMDFKQADVEDLDRQLADAQVGSGGNLGISHVDSGDQHPLLGVPDEQKMLGLLPGRGRLSEWAAIGDLCTDESKLLGHLGVVETYLALTACRQITMQVVAERLRAKEFTLADVGGRVDNLMAIVKLSAFQGGSDNMETSGHLSVAWDVVLRLLHTGIPEVTGYLIRDACKLLLAHKQSVQVVQSFHPVPDISGIDDTAQFLRVPGAETVLVEFDRRSVLSDFFLPQFHLNVGGAVAESSGAPLVWACDVCSTRNAASAPQCSLCEKLRADDAALAPGEAGSGGVALSGGRKLGGESPKVFGVDTSPIVVAGDQVSIDWSWKKIRPGQERRILPPLWGFKARVRALTWASAGDDTTISAPLGWPLLRLLMANTTTRRAVIRDPDGGALFQALVRYLMSSNAPHKAFVCRSLTQLLHETKLCRGSPLRVATDADPASDAPEDPSWPLVEVVPLYISMIERVKEFKLRLGMWTASPFFRNLLDLNIMLQPVLEMTDFYQGQNPGDREWYISNCKVATAAKCMMHEEDVPAAFVAEAVDSFNEVELIKQCLLAAEAHIVGELQSFEKLGFPRGRWLIEVQNASTPPDLLRCIKLYEAPLEGRTFAWTKDGYEGWLAKAPTGISALAALLLELQQHIRDEAMAPAWQSRKRDFEATLSGIAAGTSAKVAPAPQIAAEWPLRQFEALVTYVDRCINRSGRMIDSFAPWDIKPDDPELENFPSLIGVDTSIIRGKYLCIQWLNKRATELLLLTDTTSTAFLADLPAPGDAAARPACVKPAPWSIGGRLVFLKRLFFMQRKMSAMSALLMTRYNLVGAGEGGIHEVLINRIQANQSRAQLTALAGGAEVDDDDNDGAGDGAATPADLAEGGQAILASVDREELEGNTFWGQLFEQLDGAPADKLRRKDQQFKVRYAGEGGHDVGGLYRDLLTNAVEELMSPMHPLFVRPSDGEPGKWMPNPGAATPVQLRQFEAIGLIAGYQCLSLSNTVGLDLGRIVWKRLCGERLTLDDLQHLDDGRYRMVTYLREEGTSIDEDLIEDAVFAEPDLAGQSHDLVPGGRDVQVTPASVVDYTHHVEGFLLSQFDRQISALRNGVGRMIPLRSLPLFTWQEMERLVAGVADVDVDVLKRKAVYKGGVNEADEHVQLFWQVLTDDFSVDDRKQFLKFVWGRTRLPATESDWGQHSFKITPHMASSRVDGDAVNNHFPVAHTCFFQLELPRYTSREAVRDKVLFAQRNCAGIDADDTAEGRANMGS